MLQLTFQRKKLPAQLHNLRFCFHYNFQSACPDSLKCTSISLHPKTFIKHRNRLKCLVSKKVLLTCSSILSNYVPVEKLFSPLSSTYIIQDLKPFNMHRTCDLKSFMLFNKSVLECFASYSLFVLFPLLPKAFLNDSGLKSH